MTRQRFFLAALGMLVGCSFANAQAPSVLYTWPGVGNVSGWQDGGKEQFADVQNSTTGQLTVTEGDPINPAPGKAGKEVAFLTGIANQRRESSLDSGGLDLTGLSYIELDIAHNSPTATVNVQLFAQLTPTYTYVSGNSDDTLGRTPTFGADWALGPGPHTIKIPVSQMTPAEQAYIIRIGVDVRDHVAVGNLVWNISEVRSVGTPLTTRVLASHDAGSSDNGLNGAYVNFDGGAANILNSTGQGQSGLSENPANGGSLEWTDLGGGAGAAMAWGNGTFFNGNNFNERPASFDNYTQVKFRVKATDALNQGGTIGAQSYFQNNNYADYQVPGTQNLPIDGQYHDLVFSLVGIHELQNVDAFGINFGTHANNLLMDVDSVTFSMASAGVQGDYNGNGVVDMADYVLWRNGGPLQNEVNTVGTVDATDYDAWRSRFGNTSGSGSLNGAAIPEPTGLALMSAAVVGGFLGGRRRG